jgi:phenylalanyl-tRNA synthetase beta chain
MKVSLSWLKEYVPIHLPVKDLADNLTMAGLEIEAITDRYAELATTRVGRIKSVSAHPNADRLRVCQVDVGDRELTIVCGAANAAADLLVPVAMPGTVLPDGMKIKTSVIRGQRSDGMLCGAPELGLGPDSGGLMLLDGHLTVGAALTEALGLSDPVFEVGLTPNRADCLSFIGIAREVAAIEKCRVSYPPIPGSDAGNDVMQHTSVRIEAPDHCQRYAAALIEDVAIAPSPFWLQDRLLSIGLRPVNNVVDITNFVMMEMGQPLHAFDFDRLADHRIVVRTAKAGERFTTLDGKTHRLEPDMLMICDGQKPVAVAGVMGGLNSEIESDTTRVLLESACFDPISVRKTAKRLGIGTDASHRFERGVDPLATVRAMNRAAALIEEIAGGRRVSGHIDENPVPFQPRCIALSVPAANRLLGTAIDREEMTALLAAIEIDVQPSEETSTLRVTPPSYRVDISRPEDLMEEIARLWGYQRIPTTFPLMTGHTVALPNRVALRGTLRTLMTGLGFSEAVNYSFESAEARDWLRLDPEDPRRRTLQLLNPLSEDQAVMRSSLVSGLLQTMARNASKQIRDMRLFEIGKTFIVREGGALPQETEMLVALWTGARNLPAWQGQADCDFYDIKGALEALLLGLDVRVVHFTALPDAECRYTRPGHTALVSVGQTALGIVGEVHPKTLRMTGLKNSAFIFELNLEVLTGLIPVGKTFSPLSRFPSISRDITLIVDEKIESGRIVETVITGDDPYIENVHLFDVFKGSPIPEGKKSISFRITYRSPEGTLEDEVINSIHTTLSQRLIHDFKADLPA